MGFKPTPGTHYHIIAKHSGKALGLQNKSAVKGAKVQQQTLDTDASTQQFKFDAGPDHRYWVKPKSADLYFDISGESAADGADLCVWEWNAGKGNQLFQFIPSGGGYYYIMAAHSGKFIDVYGISKEDDARVTQISRNEGPNQQFKIVPAGQIYNDIESLPFVVEDTSGRMKDLVAGIAGNVPEVGSALKGIVSFFWPTSGQQAVWQQIKDYVDALVRDLISQERVIQLEQKLQGIHNAIDLYQGTSFGSPQKGQYFSNVLTALVQAEPNFFDPRDPHKVLTYFVALGTINLTTLREQVLFYKNIYGVDDPDAAIHLQTLKNKIKSYKEAADKSRKKALEWRLGLVTLDKTEETSWGALGPSKTEIWTLVDKYNGNRARWSYNSLTKEDSRARARRGVLRADEGHGRGAVLGGARQLPRARLPLALPRPDQHGEAHAEVCRHDERPLRQHARDGVR